MRFRGYWGNSKVRQTGRWLVLVAALAAFVAVSADTDLVVSVETVVQDAVTSASATRLFR